LIEIVSLYKSYGENNVLRNINLSVSDNEIHGLVGRSGVGKSTLLRCINGLEKYDSGSLKIDGFEIKQHSNREIMRFRKNIGMIFQNFALMERRTVYQNVALPMKCWGYKKDEIDKRVRELLRIVDIEDKIHEKPRVLSGGQKQRVAIARALSLNPKILLCDEATSALDPKTTKSILLLLEKINETFGIAIVLVTHQMSIIKQICHRVSILEDSEISAQGTVSKIFMNQPQSLKNLLGEEDLVLGKGINIRITHIENSINKKILSNMVKELDVDFSILSARVEEYRDATLGSIVINFEEESAEAVIDYLTNLPVRWEILKR
jgi:D-methionine transport system ATP-binding protein